MGISRLIKSKPPKVMHSNISLMPIVENVPSFPQYPNPLLGPGAFDEGWARELTLVVRGVVLGLGHVCTWRTVEIRAGGSPDRVYLFALI